MTNTVTIYADGSCSGNPGHGGWASILYFDAGIKCTLTGGSPDTTNNKMELSAIVETFKFMVDHDIEVDEVHLKLDSKYVLDGMRLWIHNWKKNGWKSSSGTVKNIELWKSLDNYKNRLNCKFHYYHIKSHAGHVHNEAVDSIAVISRNKSKNVENDWVDSPNIVELKPGQSF